MEWLNMTSGFPGVSSIQATLILPLESTAIRGLKEKPEELEMFFGVEKVAPPSEDRLNKMFELLAVSSSHTTLMLPVASTAIWGVKVKRGSLETFFGEEKSCA